MFFLFFLLKNELKITIKKIAHRLPPLLHENKHIYSIFYIFSFTGAR